MAVVRFEKVVSALPGTLTPNTLYMVRVGDGFDVYVSDSTGAVAHALNSGGGGGAAETLGTITGQTLDLSSGNVFDYTPTENTTFAFLNPPAAGSPFTFKLILNGAETADGYDLVNASYDSVSFSVAGQEGSPRGIFFKPDGTKFYMIGTGNDRVYQYSLSTPWVLSTAAYDNIFSPPLQGFPTGIFFKPDGTRMYLTSPSSDGIYQYDLSPAWDIASATFTGSSGLSNNPNHSVFSLDGTRLFSVLVDVDRVSQRPLSTAWDISTLGVEEAFLNVNSQESAPLYCEFKPDGTKLYVGGPNSYAVHQYSCPTPFSLVGVTYDNVAFSVSAEGVRYSLLFNDDGTKFYGLSFGGVVYQYNAVVSAPATFDYPASVKFPGGSAPASPVANETDTLEFLTVDGGASYLARPTGDNYS